MKAKTKRRKASDCKHFIVSIDNATMCETFDTMMICGHKCSVYYRESCKGVCKRWEKEGGDDGQKVHCE